MALIQQHRFQARINTDSLPIGIDEPYRFLISEDPIGLRGGINHFVYVRNNPLNWIDPWGLKPGDPYPSQDSTAEQAILDINPTSIQQHIEYAGMIYQNSTICSYSYTQPNKGTRDSSNPGGPSSVPSGTTATAYYHTHGGNDPGYDNENFSTPDKNYANYYSIDGYLGTPSGAIKKYTNPTGTISTIRRGSNK